MTTSVRNQPDRAVRRIVKRKRVKLFFSFFFFTCTLLMYFYNPLLLLLPSLTIAVPLAPREMPANDVTSEVFMGLGTFAHLPYERCLSNSAAPYDIAVVGIPFDTGTSYRPGARFGPSGIREGSRRTIVAGTYNVPLSIDPMTTGLTMVDCGDIPVTPFDNDKAMDQIFDGYLSLLQRHPSFAYTNSYHHTPRLLTLGGDHTIVLPILRALHHHNGGRPVSVIHFDSHIDTWTPYQFEGRTSPNLNHGTYFYFAAKEGLISADANIHVGIRSKLHYPEDYADDARCGFQLVEAAEIDVIGTQGIINRIRETVGDNDVYLSLDIDVLDPSFAPATGTPETGGFSTRELRRIIQGLEGLNLVGADVVEVAPAYDTNAQLTAMAAADIMYDVLSIMAKHPPQSYHHQVPH